MHFSLNLLPMVGLRGSGSKKQQLIVPLHASHMLSCNIEHIFLLYLKLHDRHTLMTGLKTYLAVHLKSSFLFAPRKTKCQNGQTDRRSCCMWPVKKQGIYGGKSTFQSLKNNYICSPCIKKSFSSQQESNKKSLVLFTYHIT